MIEATTGDQIRALYAILKTSGWILTPVNLSLAATIGVELARHPEINPFGLMVIAMIASFATALPIQFWNLEHYGKGNDPFAKWGHAFAERHHWNRTGRLTATAAGSLMGTIEGFFGDPFNWAAAVISLKLPEVFPAKILAGTSMGFGTMLFMNLAIATGHMDPVINLSKNTRLWVEDKTNQALEGISDLYLLYYSNEINSGI